MPGKSLSPKFTTLTGFAPAHASTCRPNQAPSAHISRYTGKFAPPEILCRSRLGSVAIIIGLVRSLSGDAYIGGLLVLELGQPDAKLGKMEACHLLVQCLGKHVYLVLVLAGAGIGEELDLSQGLI